MISFIPENANKFLSAMQHITLVSKW